MDLQKLRIIVHYLAGTRDFAKKSGLALGLIQSSFQRNLGVVSLG
jgi:hypothetical protein